MSAEPGALKVLHVYRTYFPDTQGGGEEVIRQVCGNTAPHGIESRVFTLSPTPAREPIERPEALVFQARRHAEIASCGISLSAFGAFREQARWADILHYHFPWPYGDLLHLSQREVKAKPTVISYHSDVIRQKALYAVYKPLMRRFLRHVDRIVATSPNYADNSALLPAYRDKVRIIPIGINDGNYPEPTGAEIDALRKKFGGRFLFFVGVFRYYKGLSFLLEAARLCDTPLVLAGGGPEEASLQRFARSHGLNHVHFVGRVSDREKTALLAASRGLVFPSHLPSESFGIALLEAAMVGRPMISCEIGTGTTYVNIDGETGLVVPPGDAPALARAMVKLTGDDELNARLGIAARQRYESLFTGEEMGRQFARLYTELAARESAERR